MEAHASTLGKYQLLRRIASGGMAEIFIAKVTGISGFEKIVVVKRILPQLASHTEFIQMFLDEARIAATLHHANIVQMYDIGAIGGQYFISMEYLHGEDVRSLMRALRQRREALPLGDAIHIVAGLAAGLHYAHEKVGFDGRPLDIVHRDVTPQNVFITYDGQIKIVDFGIAKASIRLGETRLGTLKGKIPYMSPEQCRSEILDRQSDIYSIGILLYELTTGYRLYRGQSEFEIMKQIVEGTVAPPSTVRPSYPPELEAIVMKALSKKKGDRHQTAQILQAELEAFARQSRLTVSSISMAQSMEKIFGKRVEAWRDAAAAGKLAAHVAEKSVASSDAGVEDVDAPAVTPMSRLASASAAGQLAPVAVSARRFGPLAAAAGVGAALLAILVWVTGTRTAEETTAQLADEKPSPTATKAARAEPTASLGILKITTRPQGATVWVDGAKWQETTPTVVDALAPGTHRLKLAIPGYVVVEREVATKANETTVLDVLLSRERTASGPGELRIGSVVRCQVSIDGKVKGFTPLQLKLPPGRYTVRCENSRFGAGTTRAVVVRPGQVTHERF